MGLNKYYVPHEYVKAVVDPNNEIKSLLLLGQAGVGKSYNVTKILSDIKADYIYKSGFTSPLALYKFLYENRHSGLTLVFDDIYGILDTNQAVSLMLQATYENSGKRIISWETTKDLKGIPNEFEFEANIILITNKLPKRLSSSLIDSRCLTYEYKFSNDEIIGIMEEISKQKHPKLSNKQRKEILEFIKLNVDETTDKLDLRIQKKVEDLCVYDKNNWKSLAQDLIPSKNKYKVLIKQLLEECSSIDSAQQEFSKETGKHRATFYRYKAELK